jgi:hypothetical protein
LYAHFAPAFATTTYEFWVKRDRPIAPLSTAVLLRNAQTNEHHVEITVLRQPGGPVARVEWLDFSGDAFKVCRVFENGNSEIEVRTLLTTGATTTAPAITHWPAELPAVARIALRSDKPLASLPQSDAVLRLLDRDGAVIGEAVFLQSTPARDQQ